MSTFKVCIFFCFPPVPTLVPVEHDLLGLCPLLAFSLCGLNVFYLKIQVLDFYSGPPVFSVWSCAPGNYYNPQRQKMYLWPNQCLVQYTNWSDKWWVWLGSKDNKHKNSLFALTETLVNATIAVTVQSERRSDCDRSWAMTNFQFSVWASKWRCVSDTQN